MTYNCGMDRQTALLDLATGYAVALRLHDAGAADDSVAQGEALALTTSSIDGPAGARGLRVVGKGCRVRSAPVDEPLEELLGICLASRRVRVPRRNAAAGGGGAVRGPRRAGHDPLGPAVRHREALRPEAPERDPRGKPGSLPLS